MIDNSYWGPDKETPEEPRLKAGVFHLYLASPKHLAMIVSNIFIAAGLSAGTVWQGALCLAIGGAWIVIHVLTRESKP